MALWKMTIEGKSYGVDVQRLDGATATVVVDGVAYEVAIDEQARPVEVVAAPRPAASAPAPAAPAPRPAADGELRAPLPGLVLDVRVQVGQQVEAGQVVVRIEAMKMENDVRAPRSGAVAEVLVRKGDTVHEGAPLLRIG